MNVFFCSITTNSVSNGEVSADRAKNVNFVFRETGDAAGLIENAAGVLKRWRIRDRSSCGWKRSHRPRSASAVDAGGTADEGLKFAEQMRRGENGNWSREWRRRTRPTTRGHGERDFGPEGEAAFVAKAWRTDASGDERQHVLAMSRRQARILTARHCSRGRRPRLAQDVATSSTSRGHRPRLQRRPGD